MTFLKFKLFFIEIFNFIMKKDYYEILGVSRNASQDEIKQSYRRLAHQYHPDKGGDAEKFKEINEAYQVLSDPEKRKKYDAFGHSFEGYGGTAGVWENVDFGDIFGGFQESSFDDIFSDFFGGFGRRQSKTRQNIIVDVEISLEEAYFGKTFDLSFSRQVTCQSCRGSGAHPKSALKTCYICKGKGKVSQTKRILFGSFSTVSTCSQCRGRGKIPEKNCAVCDGKGYENLKENISVTIPPGVEDSSIITIKEKGNFDPEGGQGDLLIRVRIKPHPIFVRKGANIYSSADISFPKAVLGGKIEVKTINGKVMLNIPPGTQNKSQFLLKGKGMPKYSGFGDHIVTVNIIVPRKISAKAKLLLKELENELE